VCSYAAYDENYHRCKRNSVGKAVKAVKLVGRAREPLHMTQADDDERQRRRVVVVVVYSTWRGVMDLTKAVGK
jgi:hypothetical protein